LDRATEDLHRNVSAGQRVFSCVADVSDPAAAGRLIGEACDRLTRFTGLVNNAGINGPKGRLEDCAWHEWVRTFEVNFFGTALLCQAAIPAFRRAGYGKIVNLSGGGAVAPMPGLSAYAASKVAVVRLTETLAHETASAAITVNAVAPGALNTRMLDEVLAAGPGKVGEAYYQRLLQQKANGGASIERAAALIVYLLSEESDGISGRLLSAVWDPWPILATRAGQLGGTDVYTLRRILPKDRGLNWDQG
jgi:3-oxoacyl-[acyl-carrier protein] reductase